MNQESPNVDGSALLAPRRHLIACHVLWRECCALLHRSPYAWTFDFLRKELHDTPAVLHRRLQAAIDVVDRAYDEPYSLRHEPERRPPEAIVLGYGLCSKAVEGLHSTRLPLVLPRAHDCITLLLGSRRRYDQYFAAHPGTFWFSPGWVETTVMPSKERLERLRVELSAKYDDPEDVDFIIECESQWMNEYRRATYVSHWPEDDGSVGKVAAQKSARELGWEMDMLVGSDDLLNRLLNGLWDENDDFLVAQPGQTFRFTGDSSIVKIAKCDK